jgi:hypothetical protein
MAPFGSRAIDAKAVLEVQCRESHQLEFCDISHFALAIQRKRCCISNRRRHGEDTEARDEESPARNELTQLSYPYSAAAITSSVAGALVQA